MYFLKLYIIKQLKYFICESFCISNKKHFLPCQTAWAAGWESPYQMSLWGWRGKPKWDILETEQPPNVSGLTMSRDQVYYQEKQLQPVIQETRGVCCKYLTVTQVGTRSHLFRTKIRCFQDFSFFRYVSMLLDRVPIGSRASSTWMMTSDESITCKNKRGLENDHTTLYCTNILHKVETIPCKVLPRFSWTDPFWKSPHVLPPFSE